VTPEAGGRVVAVVKDLFFVARIREVARLAGVPVEFARARAELEQALAAGPLALVLMDLTAPDWDYPGFFDAIAAAAPRPTVLAFTTHALAARTKPLHHRCDRVVTKETLTRELGDILRGAPR
jgi:CheY-like chemotaxis protein